MLIQEKLALEDALEDILNKALRGLKLSAEELSERTDVPLETIQGFRNGHFNKNQQDALSRVAFALNLNPAALLAIATGDWYPQPVAPMDGFAMFTTAYGDMTVNAFLVWDPKTGEAASFDTGSSCQPILDAVQTNQLSLKRIFITHTHMDHLADLDRLQSSPQANQAQALSYGSAAENPLGLKPLMHGDGLLLGGLKIRVLGTSGHTPGGLSYFIQGLEKPLVVVGDALFAGSMGGAPYAYAEALNNNRQYILSLPPETIVCPGHGPLSTVGEARTHNPFFPNWP